MSIIKDLRTQTAEIKEKGLSEESKRKIISLMDNLDRQLIEIGNRAETILKSAKPQHDKMKAQLAKEEEEARKNTVNLGA
jgi:hypothetical protein